MANETTQTMKTLNTRLQLKYDSYDNWKTNNPLLLEGEVAIAYVPVKTPETANTNVTDGGVDVARTEPPHLLMKVGDGKNTYNQLQFVSGLAADVNGYAKMSAADFEAAVKTLSSAQFATDIASYAQAISDLEELVGSTSVEDQIETALGDYATNEFVGDLPAGATATTVVGYIDEAVGEVSDKIGTVPTGHNDVIAYVNSKTTGLATSNEVSGLSDAVETVSGKVTTLIGSDTGKSVRAIAVEEITATLVAADAKEAYDTLAEMAAWIQAHPEDASAMNEAITALQTKLTLGTYTEGTGESATTKEYSTVKAYVEAYVEDSINPVSDRVQAIESRFGSATDILVFNCGNSQIGTENEYN